MEENINKKNNIQVNALNVGTEKASKNQNKTKLILDTPKSQTSYREIPLLSPIVKELKTHKQKQKIEIQLAGKSYVNKDFLFCNQIGEPYD